ncbi:hypothetical protein ACWD6R_17440 [Streptomyces sp. NPDC005151]
MCGHVTSSQCRTHVRENAPKAASADNKSTTAPETLRARYGKYADFEKLMARYDPSGTFRNDFLDRHFPK